jgi:hypothetical protein
VKKGAREGNALKREEKRVSRAQHALVTSSSQSKDYLNLFRVIMTTKQDKRNPKSAWQGFFAVLL